MLHKIRVLKALYGNSKRQLRIFLRIKPRPKTPILSRPVPEILEFHSLICRRLNDLWPAGLDLHGESVCEIGPGDCLASAAYFVAKGASHVDLVELEPPVANAKQLEVLKQLKAMGFPISLDVIQGDPPGLNGSLVSYHRQFVEDYDAADRHGFVFSHNVMEHVEDLHSCFRAIHRCLRPGGRMFHVIDLGGHGQFEDPLPPLDFQTYPDWLFECMYPTNYRNTRRFLEDYREAARSAGFANFEIRPLRVADKSYVESLRNKLRPAAQRQSAEDLSVIEFTLSAFK
ncbi:MAG TPA: methyltransferase domain-containing protein [Chthoniobacteraceae bacterium]|nr:methyltransferase domain-containing protein [Chthoniobacteraceae bacterium]